MARNPKLRRGVDLRGAGLGTLAFRTVVPALYGAVLMAHKFSPRPSPSPWMLAAVGLFLLHFLWRIHALLRGGSVQDVERVEVGLLAMLALATALHLVGPPFPWPTAAYGILLVSFSASVPFPGILALPLATVFTGGSGRGWLPDLMEWMPHLINLELLALAAGAVVAGERRRRKRLAVALEKLRLDAEHLDARTEGMGAEKKGDLSRLDDILYSTLSEVKENAGAHGAILALRNPKGELFIREIVSDNPNIQEQKILALDGTAFQWVLKNRKPLVAGHLQDPGRRLGYYSGSVSVKSFVGVPLSEGGDEVEGVLALDALREGAFSEAQVTMLKVASHQVSTILKQIRALEQTKREARDFKALHDFSKRLITCTAVPELLDLILTAVRERIQPDFSSAALADGDGKLVIETVGSPDWISLRGSSFRPEDGLAGWVFSGRQYLHYSDFRNRAKRPLFSRELKAPEFRSLLIHPLAAQGGALGVLCLGSASVRAFDPSAVAFCEILAQQTAQAILHLQHVEKLRELATTDSLTRLANRRVFFDRLDEELRRSRRYPQSLALVVLDVDRFKKINDRLGHPAGDEVLRCLAGALRGFARETDMVARHGGEEFALLLPGTDEPGAQALAERIRAGVEALRVEWEGKTIPVRVSIGVTAVEGDSDTAERIVSRADQALYAAKETGRNRVITFSEIREYASWQ